jgi:structure-specific recognition protein 1
MGGSSYFAFQKEKRPEVVAKYPNLKVTEVAKKLGELWKALSESEKQVYKELAAKSGGGSTKKKDAAKPKGKKGKKGSDSD